MGVSELGQGEHDRRATVRLLHYWLSLRRNHSQPAFVDFDPRRNPVPWDNCLLASCRLPREVIYEHIGAGLVAVDAEAPSAAADTPESLGFVQKVMRLLPIVLRTGEVQQSADSYHRPGGGIVLFRAALLPFRGTGEAWSYVLGAATYRIEAEMRPAAAAIGEAAVERLPGYPVVPPPGKQAAIDRLVT
jgi:hypothetical protein